MAKSDIDGKRLNRLIPAICQGSKCFFKKKNFCVAKVIRMKLIKKKRRASEEKIFAVAHIPTKRPSLQGERTMKKIKTRIIPTDAIMIFRWNFSPI